MPRQPNDEDVRSPDADATEPDAAHDGALPYADLPLPRPARPLLGGLVKIGAPALAAAALTLMLLSDSHQIDHELQLVFPPRVVAGQALPLRAVLYSQLRDIEGPKLAQRLVHVQLQRHNTTLSDTWLHPSHGAPSRPHDMEGVLQVPSDARPPLRVLASTHVGNNVLQIDVVLELAEKPASAAVVGRSMRALQQFSEGPIQVTGGPSGDSTRDTTPPELRTRVAGGACVPELACRLLVYVGEPASAIWVEPNSTLTPSRSSAQPSAAVSGVVALEVTTHGPEAELWLRASRQGQLVARRSVRLPIALASDVLSVGSPLVPPASLPHVRLASAADGCNLDAFALDTQARNTWVATGSLAHCDALQPLPLRLPGAGTYRLQAQPDPFSADIAAVQVIYVRGAADADADVLSALALRAHAVDPSDPLVQRVRAQPTELAATALVPTAAYLSAVLEAGLVPPPRAISSLPQSLERWRQAQARLRFLSLCALGLAAVSLALAVGRRGLWASTRAGEILVSAGQDAAASERARLRRLAAVIASVLALVLVFVVVGLYIMARGSLR